MESLLKRKNLPHVETIGTGTSEELFDGNVNIRDVILGMSELNRNKICLLEISVGTSNEGITKIKNVIENGGLYNTDTETWVDKQPTLVDFLPEGENFIPFKSDSWALGEFIVRQHTKGKTIPRRFMKSQELLNKFIDTLPDSEILRKILILDPYTREFTWNIVKEDTSCIIQ